MAVSSSGVVGVRGCIGNLCSGSGQTPLGKI